MTNLVGRAVHAVGIATRPDEASMQEAARNLLNGQGGALASTRFLIIGLRTATAAHTAVTADGAWDILVLLATG